MRLFKLNTSVHKWLSLVVGLQLLIWLGTGLYFNLMDHNKASGNELRVHSHHEGNITDFIFTPIKDITSEAPQEVKLIWILHQPSIILCSIRASIATKSAAQSYLML